MANASLVITVKTEHTQAELQQFFQKPINQPREEAQALSEFFKKAASLQERCIMTVQTGALAPVAASATLTLVSAIATDAITIGTITMTATSSPTTNLHWEIDGASDALDAASLCAAINANPTLATQVFATVAENVVTVTARAKGNDGNAIPISSADATITASGAFLAGGTGGIDDAGVVYTLGIA